MTEEQSEYRDALARAILNPRAQDLVDAVDRCLYRCPFCGVGTGRLRILSDSDCYRGIIGIFCSDCGAAYLGDETVLINVNVLDFTASQIREVADGWNRREP